MPIRKHLILRHETRLCGVPPGTLRQPRSSAGATVAIVVARDQTVEAGDDVAARQARCRHEAHRQSHEDIVRLRRRDVTCAKR